MTRVYEVLKRKFEDRDEALPLELKYIKRIRFLLTTLGCWPHKQFGKVRLDAVLSMYNSLLICIGIISPIMGAVYLWYYRGEITFLNMGHIVLTILLDFLYLPRIILGRTDKYREAIKCWLLEFHLFYFNSRSQYVTKIKSQVHIISGMMALYAQCLLYFGLSLFTFQPWYNNYSKGMFGDNRPANTTFEHAVYYYCPFEEVYTTVKGYWILFIFNMFNSYNVTVVIVIFDCLLSLIVLQIWGHLKILNHNLSCFPSPEIKNGVYSAKENVEIRKLLKENIVYHQFITKFVNQCSNAFSEHLFLFYFLVQVISCILLLELSALTVDAIAKYGPLTFAIYQQLIQVSILFEMLNTKSEQLINSVYELPWERMDTSNRRTVMFLLHRVQTPLSLKAAKVVPVGVQTMFAIIKTSFTYCMMLITLAGEK